MAEPQPQVAPVDPQHDDELSPEELEDVAGGSDINNCQNGNCPCQSGV